MERREIDEYLDRRFRELAVSGDHGDYLSIETASRAEGYPRARWFFDDRFRRL